MAPALPGVPAAAATSPEGIGGTGGLVAGFLFGIGLGLFDVVGGAEILFEVVGDGLGADRERLALPVAPGVAPGDRGLPLDVAVAYAEGASFAGLGLSVGESDEFGAPGDGAPEVKFARSIAGMRLA